MKKLIFILVIVLLALGAWISWNVYTIFFVPNPQSIAQSTGQIIPKPVEKNSDKEFILNNEHFNYSLFTLSNISSLTLIPNFSEKESSQTIIEKNNCKQAINGGFYDKQNKPLGLFITGGQTIGKQIPSALLNGFLSIQSDNNVSISNEVVSESSRIALQSGPLLIQNSEALPLRIQNDEHARRMIAAQTQDGKLIFIAIYNADAVFEGPLLADLPDAIQTINKKEALNISNALNLDGGSASAFHNADTSLSEFTPVGSLFCVQ